MDLTELGFVQNALDRAKSTTSRDHRGVAGSMQQRLDLLCCGDRKAAGGRRERDREGPPGAIVVGDIGGCRRWDDILRLLTLLLWLLMLL